MSVLDRIEALTGVPVLVATADAGYADAKVYGKLEGRKTAADPPKAKPIDRLCRCGGSAMMPSTILKYPRGKVLKVGRAVKHGRFSRRAPRIARTGSGRSVSVARSREQGRGTR